MKKSILLKISVLIFVCTAMCIMLFGCSLINRGEPPINTNLYVATFKVNGSTYTSELAGSGRVSKPIKDPELPCHKFVCWSTDPNKNVPYDFSTEITESITLYAYFIFDMESAQAEAEKVSSSIVKVVNTYTENGEEKIREGVGVVYHIVSGYCFVVTNCHTVSTFDHQTNPKIKVYDKENNEFEALVYKHPDRAPAIDIKYDLALIAFEYEGDVIGINEDIDIIDNMGDGVISVGSSTAVSTGTVNDYKIVDVDIDSQLSDVDFEVYCHNAIPNTDVKECLTYNTEMKLIGITYYSDNGVAYTIPTGRIAMFLNEYLYG